MATVEVTEEELQRMRNDLEKYKPGSEMPCSSERSPPDKIFIGLFGRTGCGKTSLINSLRFAAKGNLKKSRWLQTSNPSQAGGHTMFRTAAEIIGNINVVDNRGLDHAKSTETLKEMKAQLDGKRGYNKKVIWQDDFLELQDAVGESTCDPISVAVFVVSARHDIDFIEESLMGATKLFHQQLGLYPAAVITNVKSCDPSYIEQLKIILCGNGIAQCDIFEVDNITDQKQRLEPGYQKTLLQLLERCIFMADFSFRFRNGREGGNTQGTTINQNEPDPQENPRRGNEDIQPQVQIRLEMGTPVHEEERGGAQRRPEPPQRTECTFLCCLQSVCGLCNRMLRNID